MKLPLSAAYCSPYSVLWDKATLSLPMLLSKCIAFAVVIAIFLPCWSSSPTSPTSSHSIYFWVICEEYSCVQRHLPHVTSKSWWMEPDIRAPVNMPKGTSCRRSTSAASAPCSAAAAGSKWFLEQALIGGRECVRPYSRGTTCLSFLLHEWGWPGLIHHRGMLGREALSSFPLHFICSCVYCDPKCAGEQRSCIPGQQVVGGEEM